MEMKLKDAGLSDLVLFAGVELVDLAAMDAKVSPLTLLNLGPHLPQ
jgi:hypothetical protein